MLVAASRSFSDTSSAGLCPKSEMKTWWLWGTAEAIRRAYVGVHKSSLAKGDDAIPKTGQSPRSMPVRLASGPSVPTVRRAILAGG